jgi:hypothetical protein
LTISFLGGKRGLALLGGGSLRRVNCKSTRHLMREGCFGGSRSLELRIAFAFFSLASCDDDVSYSSGEGNLLPVNVSLLLSFAISGLL